MNVSRETLVGSKTEHIERKKKDQKKDQIKEKGYSEKITIKIMMFHVKHQWTTKRKIKKEYNVSRETLTTRNSENVTCRICKNVSRETFLIL